MTIANFAEVNDILAQYVPIKRGVYTLERMHQIMDLLGNPQNSLKVIHVAGTAGKTSTCYYVSKMLQLSGKTVGLTVSPHIDEVNERLQINGQPLAEPEFCALFSEFLSIQGLQDLGPTYFELLIAFAYWVFARKQVDYAVIEVGLGGLLDGTNVVSRQDKICIITDIGLDHTHILGNTITEITTQKAGIITPYNVVFMAQQKPEITKVAADIAAKNSATVFTLASQQISQAPVYLPEFQKRNWSLAKFAYEYVVNRDKLTQLSSQQLDESTHLIVPGRMEMIRRGSKTIILDGAHNTPKFELLTKSLQSQLPNQKVALLIGMIESKQEYLDECAQIIAPLAIRVIATTFYPKQDLPHQCIDPTIIAHAFLKVGKNEAKAVNDLAQAVDEILTGPEAVVLVTGSLYLLGCVRQLL